MQDSKDARDLINENLVAPVLEHFEKTDFKAKISFDKERPQRKHVHDPSRKWKFANFDLDRWEETQKLKLKDSFTDPFFM